jgi:HAD superfamily hydrolase (TIGR01484 family)
VRPLRELTVGEGRRIRAVFTDIDDTLTAEGLLEAEAFSAMWRLQQAGVAVVPVTGRPAGWCDHFARMWPVAGVVGENGAFYYRLDGARFVRVYALPEAQRATLQTRLGDVRERILRAVPRARVASDQAFRIHDLAIDFAEDVRPALSGREIDRIVELFTEAGATAKVSSIHVNGWFGSYDKLSMIRRFAAEVLDLAIDAPRGKARAIYVGDSPNDEPAFAAFTLSAGVANIRAFADRIRHPPRYVTRAPGGRGFAELARRILAARQFSGSR